MQANSNHRTNGKPPLPRATPPLPESDYKVVYRPRTGMKLSSWPDEKITEGIARASGSPFKEFCANVIIQTQWKQKLIIASTTDEDYALKLGSINSIQQGAATYEVTPYIKPLPGTVRGVVQGITACMTEKRLAELLTANNCGMPAREDARQIHLSSDHLRRNRVYKMNNARTEDKAELKNEFRAELAKAVVTISKSVAATVQAAVQTLRQEITQMGNELSQRISVLEKDSRQEKSQNNPSEKPR
ncbi:hypothetical protein HPB49_009071 [Dermacentor silvarum]|uniref:Uncharacterized protein n=1 Tax=Dermacentor silvarum TaxID=543639 RepID=A0ACB8DY68_DERSI|nr:hypothetical protein HPB49_009071 [Dermacentor silvarum]